MLFPAGAAGATLPPFVKGFVEINSPVELSVTAVYTSQTCYNPLTKQPNPDASGKGIIPIPRFCTNLGELELEVVPQNHFVGDTACRTP